MQSVTKKGFVCNIHTNACKFQSRKQLYLPVPLFFFKKNIYEQKRDLSMSKESNISNGNMKTDTKYITLIEFSNNYNQSLLTICESDYKL